MAETPASQSPASQSPAGKPPSDWPAGLLLDELWLRCRREVVHGLERAGLWVTGARYQRVIGEQVQHGHRLEAVALLPAFSDAERAFWRSEGAFDRGRRRLDHRVPLVLAFGSAVVALLGSMLDRELAPDDPRRRAGALFNLGISLVDLLVDERSEAARAMASWLDGARLAELCQQGAGDHHADQVGALPLDETRLVLRVVLAFFATVDVAQAPSGADRAALGRLLRQAYAAELATGAVTGPGLRWPGSRGEAGGTTSSVPFLALGWLAGVAPDSQPAGAAAGLLGEVFSALDDLVDLVDDLRAGAVNQLVAGEVGEPVSIERMPYGYQLLDELVTGTAIRERTAVLVTRLARVRDLVAVSSGRAEALTPLLCYVRNWLE
jgi:hypothetical protein